MLAAFDITLRKCRARNCARKILMPLTLTCLELYKPNANIYTGLLVSSLSNAITETSYNFLVTIDYPFLRHAIDPLPIFPGPQTLMKKLLL